jgi:hypothetical protein
LFSQHDFDAPVTTQCVQRLYPPGSDLNLALVVDISGSMVSGKLDATKLGLHAVVEQLDEDDRVTLVSFSDAARVELPSTITDASGHEALHGAITALEVEGDQHRGRLDARLRWPRSA